MTAPAFHVVPQHVARNPVARAIAKRKVAEAVRDFQTRLHLLVNGEIVTADIDATMHVLAVAGEVLSARGQDDPVIRGAMSACIACAQRKFRWHAADAVALDQGLTRAAKVYAEASAVETQRAYVAMSKVKEAA